MIAFCSVNDLSSFLPALHMLPMPNNALDMISKLAKAGLTWMGTRAIPVFNNLTWKWHIVYIFILLYIAHARNWICITYLDIITYHLETAVLNSLQSISWMRLRFNFVILIHCSAEALHCHHSLNVCQTHVIMEISYQNCYANKRDCLYGCSCCWGKGYSM